MEISMSGKLWYALIRSFSQVKIIGPPETLYEGGFFKTRLSFPKEYPQVRLFRNSDL
jgi:hypothetical protein